MGGLENSALVQTFKQLFRQLTASQLRFQYCLRRHLVENSLFSGYSKSLRTDNLQSSIPNPDNGLIRDFKQLTAPRFTFLMHKRLVKDVTILKRWQRGLGSLHSCY